MSNILVACSPDAIPFSENPPKLPEGYLESLGITQLKPETDAEIRQRKMLERMHLD
jgi:hypothetical protein